MRRKLMKCTYEFSCPVCSKRVSIDLTGRQRWPSYCSLYCRGIGARRAFKDMLLAIMPARRNIVVSVLVEFTESPSTNISLFSDNATIFYNNSRLQGDRRIASLERVLGIWSNRQRRKSSFVISKAQYARIRQL